MSAHLPPLNWLRVFEAAARHESFARASSELGMSPAAVSQQIRALESQLGAALFERRAHSVSLTDRGQAYLPGVQHALGGLVGATEALFGAAEVQRVYVQSVLLFARGVLAPGDLDFAGTHPGIDLAISTGNNAQDFSRGFSDLQIIFGNPLAHSGDSDRLLGEVLRPVAPPAIAAQITTPADLTRHALIEVSTHRAGWPHVLDAFAMPPRRAAPILVDNTVTAMALASQGVGIALARAPASDAVEASFGLVPCLADGQVPGPQAYHLICPDRRALRASVRVFRDWLIAHCAALER